jgi:predicted sulfurtransferase
MRHEAFMKAKSLEEKKVDMVNSPPHYNTTGIECIHAISAATDEGFQYYLQGNILKYLWRYRYKDRPLEDLEKARWYLDKLIEEVMSRDAS